MRRIAILLLTLAALPLFADDERAHTPLVDDVIRMSKAGVNEEAIIDFIKTTKDRFDVTADDLIAMTDAKVSKDVIRAVIDEADEREGIAPRGSERSRERVVVRPRYVYSPYWYDPWYYDPFWYGYGPRISVGFGFGPHWGYGGRRFYRGGFHHGIRRR